MQIKNIFFLISLALIAILIIASGCTQKNDDSAKYGDTVAVYYVGTLDDGSVFDKSVKGENEPLYFVIGKKQMIPGFENAVLGMKEGEVKTVTLSPEEAYGDYLPEYAFIANRSEFPEDYDLTIGNIIYISGEGGNAMKVRITNVTETKVFLDANSPLAGKSLTFEITLDQLEHPN